MIPGRPIRSLFTFEVYQPGDPPKRGDQFRDVCGHVWTVRDVREPRAAILSSPPPDYKGFCVDMEPSHPTVRVEPGERFTPVTGSRRSGEGWVGLLTALGDFIVGFGTFTRKGVPEKLSWYYRHTDGKWSLKLGPCVENPTYFAGSELVAQGDDNDGFDGFSTWVRIATSLGKYRGSDEIAANNSRPRGDV